MRKAEAAAYPIYRALDAGFTHIESGADIFEINTNRKRIDTLNVAANVVSMLLADPRVSSNLKPRYLSSTIFVVGSLTFAKLLEQAG